MFSCPGGSQLKPIGEVIKEGVVKDVVRIMSFILEEGLKVSILG